MTTPTGGGRGGGSAASSGRGRGGRSRGGRGRRNNGRNSSNKNRGDDNNNDKNRDRNGKDPSGRTSEGRRNGAGGRRQRHFSARGGGGRAGVGGGGRGSGPVDAAADTRASVKTPPPKEDRIEEKVRKMSEQDVLIAFGPHVRSGDREAKSIHQQYLSDNRQRDFVQKARKFLVDYESRPKIEVPCPVETESKLRVVEAPSNDGREPSVEEAGHKAVNNSNGFVKRGTMEGESTKSVSSDASGDPAVLTCSSHVYSDPDIKASPPQRVPPDVPSEPAIIASVQIPALTPAAATMPSPPPGLLAPTQPPGMVGIRSSNNNNSIPARPPPGMGPMPPQNPLSPSSLNRGPPPGMPPPMRPPKAMVEGIVSPPTLNNPKVAGRIAAKPPAPRLPTSSILPARTPPPLTSTPAALPKSSPDTSGPTVATTPIIKPGRVRRTQTRCEEQPGRLYANDMPAAAFNPNVGSGGPTSIVARPRSELTARWALPLPYLRNRALRRFEEQKSTHDGPPQNLTIRDALKNLTVGLFRRGASESGPQSSIVSKEILAPEDVGNGRGGGPASAQQGGRPCEDYFFNVNQMDDTVYGHVPFYAPRTPGNVLFRLYFDDEPHVTLATGPCVRVVPADGDVDSVLRFILTNFKSKKTNGISSMNSLASVFELFSPRQKNNERYFDGAGRVAWGCICESRKALSQAGFAYVKKKKELEEKLEAELEVEKIKEALPDLRSLGMDRVMEIAESSGGTDIDVNGAHKEQDEKDKANSDSKAKLSSEKYSNERKWREMQLVYASVVTAAVTNSATQLLLKRDIMAKLRLEYDLWCPLTESFAPNPFVAADDELSRLPGDVAAYPHNVTKDHDRMCRESCAKMQEQVLGFVPKGRTSLGKEIAARHRRHRQQKKRPDFFKELSSAMSELYYAEYEVSDKVWKRREKVRATVEVIVSRSPEFPPGTKVAVFGSSANGFGSPNSDLDLCLQVPPSATNANGVEAMANLAIKLTEAGMSDVDTVRLTARIPIIKFNVPYKEGSNEEEEILVECDLSLQNPLACLNTSLLHTYSKISPSTCIIASIIKRWAKARNINTPSEHTLSSYGYVIMLIHFLTSCDLNKNMHGARIGHAVVNPILPNLQWADPIWARDPLSAGGPYREIPARPRNRHSMVRHPTEPNYLINTYFYGSGLEGLTLYCAENHNADTALGVLLVSFFHYFAYDFDYRKHVVSLNTKHNSPPMEREIKAEEDGWSLFRHGLAIEDPFELFYDVAHVVKVSNFQHIRKEFCLAYTKIVDAASPSRENLSGREVIDLICEPMRSDDENTVP
mmetsp:Transcript_14111/g.30664  ORF Transcript_14111/g.30664 Transcript_14111/m.30664 type:complete len:1304 (+) Transcript_14111:121-4032(+)